MRLIHYIKIVPSFDGDHPIHLNAMIDGFGDLKESDVEDFKSDVARTHNQLRDKVLPPIKPRHIIICNVMEMRVL